MWNLGISVKLIIISTKKFIIFLNNVNDIFVNLKFLVKVKDNLYTNESIFKMLNDFINSDNIWIVYPNFFSKMHTSYSFLQILEISFFEDA